jgi:hypothetical protein
MSTPRLRLKLAPEPARADEVTLQRVPRVPVRLSPIAWGKPDNALARGLCQHVADATPATVIRFNPFTHARMRRALRALGINV